MENKKLNKGPQDGVSPRVQQKTIASLSLPNIQEIYKPHVSTYRLQKHSIEPKRTNLRYNQSTKNLKLNEEYIINNSELEQTLLKAQQERNDAQRNMHILESRVVKLAREEEKMLRKMELERKRADDMHRVRKEFEDKVTVLKKIQQEREERALAQKELNKKHRDDHFMNFHERSQEVFSRKIQSKMEVTELKEKLKTDKEMFNQYNSAIKGEQANQIRQQELERRYKIREYQVIKEQQSKIGYIERVKEEKQIKQKTDQKVKQLEEKEQDLLNKIKKSQQLLKVGQYRHDQDSFLNQKLSSKGLSGGIDYSQYNENILNNSNINQHQDSS